MRSVTIVDVKKFMAALLGGNVFDSFELTEGSVTTFARFSIDGNLYSDYFDNNGQAHSSPAERPASNPSAYTRWSLVRPYVFNLIRGKQPPLKMKFVFRLAGRNVEKLLCTSGIQMQPSDIAGLYLNIQYDAGTVICTTGTSLRIFTLDKTLEHTWDEMVQKLFRREQISFIVI